MLNINIKLNNLAQAALVTVCGLSTLALSSNTPAHAQTITGYTAFNDPNTINVTDARGINNSGAIVGYYDNSSCQAVRFFYNGSTYTNLNDPNSTYGTHAFGIKNSGAIVGYYVKPIRPVNSS
jgi:predicted amidohydrolase